MSIMFRHYNDPNDYVLVDRFLIAHYQPGNKDGNWVEPAWVHRVLWRGFGNSGEPPVGEEELESRKTMFDTPSARRDLKIVVAAPAGANQPAGNFVSLCG